MSSDDLMILDSNDIDEAIVEEVDKVDWHLVTQSEASRFGLALGLFRESVHVYQVRQAACATAMGGVISVSALVVIFCLFGVSTGAIIGGIIGSQLGRTGYLWWKARQALKHANEMQGQAIGAAKHLATQHPDG